jgi:hypothetical protein
MRQPSSSARDWCDWPCSGECSAASSRLEANRNVAPAFLDYCYYRTYNQRAAVKLSVSKRSLPGLCQREAFQQRIRYNQNLVWASVFLTRTAVKAGDERYAEKEEAALSGQEDHDVE